MKTEIKILKFLIENKEEHTIRDISKKIESDYKITYNAIQNLIKKKLLNVKNIGNSKAVMFNNHFSKDVFIAEYERKDELLKNKNLLILFDHIEKNMSSNLFVLLLFGSYAKKLQTKHSDIDLMFVVPNNQEEEFERTIHTAVSILPLSVHYLVFSEKNFTEMINSKQGNVGTEVVKNNIILYGIESYYGLIK